MKKIWIITALLALTLLTGCGKADELQAQLDELQATLTATQERLTAAEAEAREAKSELTEVQAQLSAAEKKLDALGGLAGLDDEYMSYSDADYEAVFIAKGTAIHSLPTEGAPVARTMEVAVYAPVLAQGALQSEGENGEQWVLVKLPVWSPSTASLGWVKLDAVEEYTRRNMSEVMAPVTLSDSAEVYGDKECTVPAEAMEGWEYVIEGFMDDGALAIISANCWTGYVDADDLVYPKP